MAARVAKRIINPTVLPSGERDPTLVARILNNTIGGQLNVVGEVMLAMGATETRVNDPRIGPQSFFCWQALSEPGTGPHVLQTIWLKQRGVRFAIVGHTAPVADFWVEYMVIG